MGDFGFRLYRGGLSPGDWRVCVPGNEVHNVPEPIDEDTLQKITDLLQEAGGALPLGHISQLVPGVKKSQLTSYFELNQGENGQFEVRVPGTKGERALLMHDGKPITEDQIPSLEEDQIQEIAAVIHEQGG